MEPGKEQPPGMEVYMDKTQTNEQSKQFNTKSSMFQEIDPTNKIIATLPAEGRSTASVLGREGCQHL